MSLLVDVCRLSRLGCSSLLVVRCLPYVVCCLLVAVVVSSFVVCCLVFVRCWLSVGVW